MDSVFKEYDIRGRYPEEINEALAYQVGRAFIEVKKLKKVLIARDFRWESKQVGEYFVRGLIEGGANVFDLGIDSTPSLFFGVGNGNFDGGAIITASHNPDGYTGLKMCGSDGVVLGQSTGLDKIAAIINKDFSVVRKKGKKAPAQLFADYYKFLNKFVTLKKLSGFRIVMDSSGGSGSRILDYIANRISSRVTKMNFEPMDPYPDHGLNPMLPKNNLPIRQEVKKQKADLGVLCDGDADRIIFIDEQGSFVHPLYINCLLSEIILERYGKLAIIIDARLPVGLGEVIAASGGRPVIHRAGYANIVSTMKKKKILFGCENSGHFMFNFSLVGKNNYVYGDAIIPLLFILEHLKKHNVSLSQAVKKFTKRYFISGEINISGVDFSSVVTKIRKKYKGCRFAEIDGLSVSQQRGKDYWFFNVRPSHTEPLVRINVESNTKALKDRVKKDLLKIVK